MPTYVYRRADGTTFEVQQRITEEPLTACPETGQPVKRVISANAGLIFKGSGFYLTDYARAGSNGAGKSSGGSEKNGAGKSETPAASEAAPAKPEATTK